MLLLATVVGYVIPTNPGPTGVNLKNSPTLVIFNITSQANGIGSEKLKALNENCAIGWAWDLNGLPLFNSPSDATNNEPLNSPVYFGLSSITFLGAWPSGVITLAE